MTPEELLQKVTEQWAMISAEILKQLEQPHDPDTCFGCQILNTFHSSSFLQDKAIQALSDVATNELSILFVAMNPQAREKMKATFVSGVTMGIIASARACGEYIANNTTEKPN